MKKTEGRFSTGVSRDDIVKAVFDNDCNSIAEMLEEFRFAKDGTPPHFMTKSIASNQLAVQMLTAASMSASKGTLADETANTIIQYLCYNAEIFSLLHQVKFYFGDESADYDKLPEKVIVGLKANDPTNFGSEIADLNEEQIKIFVNFVISNIDTLDRAFSSPIIKKLRGFIPDCLLFGLVAANLEEPIPDGLLGLANILGAFDSCDGDENGYHNDEDDTCGESCSCGGRCDECGKCENN